MRYLTLLAGAALALALAPLAPAGATDQPLPPASAPPAPATPIPAASYGPPAATAGPRQAWHNGSLMLVLPLGGGRVQIQYSQPRPSLWGLVGPGTVLVDGYGREGYFEGTAFVFTYCGAFPYHVTGHTSGANQLILEGPAPVIADDCFVIGYAWGSNSTLVFTLS